MATANPVVIEGGSTLPGWLDAQSRARGRSIALRRKIRGVWRARSWREVRDEVLRLARVLRAGGFHPGDRVVVFSEPRPEAVVVSLAAHRLGGAVVLLDPDHPVGSLAGDDGVGPRFAFIEKERHLATLQAALGGAARFQLAIQADARGLVPGATRVVAYDAPPDPEGAGLAEAERDDVPASAAPDDVAFLFLQRSPIERVTHREVMDSARQAVEDQRLHAEHDALSPRSFATSEHARYLLGSWLVAGFRMNFPENHSTREVDRRELGPSLVVGTAETYARLHRLVLENLPPARTLQRRLVDWALAPGAGGVDRALRTTLGEWLVRRPLRDVLGLARVDVPLVVGGALDPAVAAFFSGLGVVVRAPGPAGHRPPREVLAPVDPPPEFAAAVRERAS
jgi:long-subunit acyl-CoA synthetase (AMP-forming)